MRHPSWKLALTLTALPLALAACSSNPKSYPPLAQTRAEFQAARTSEVPALAPQQFHDAEVALSRAEAAEGEVPLNDMQHLNYMARSQLDIARNEASRAGAERDRKQLAAERDRLSAQQEAMLTIERERAADRARQANEEAASAAVAAEQERMRRQQAEAELAQFKSRQTAAGTVLTLEDVLFDTGSAQLNPGAERRLAPLVAFLKEHPDRAIVIEGHTDSQGAAEYNRHLSEQRADAVRGLLVSNGVDAGRIQTRGMGKEYPVASNATAAGRQQNRRIELTIRNPQG